MAPLFHLAALAALTLHSAAAAADIPTNLKVIPVPTDRNPCNGFYQPGGAPSKIIVSSPEDPGLDGLRLLETDTTFASDRRILGLDLRRPTRFATGGYYCDGGRLNLWPSGGALTISRAQNSAQVWTNDPAGYNVEVYYHEVDGVPQDGFYIGAANQTTWGFAYTRGAQCGSTPYYQAALLGLPQDPKGEHFAIAASESRGFLKVVAFP